MRYAILILLAGCIENTTVEPQGGESDVDGMELTSSGIPTIVSPGVLGGVAGMAADGAGGASDASLGLGGDGGGGRGGDAEGPDGGTGGAGGGEGPEAPVAGDYGDACGDHADCIYHPEDSLAGYCHVGECINSSGYTWVQQGERCGFPKALCVDDLACGVDDRCVLP